MKSNRQVAIRLTITLAVTGVLGLFQVQANAGMPVGLLASSTMGQGNFGTIKGKLVWGGSEAPAPKVLVAQGKADKDPAVCASKASLMDHNLVVDPKTKGVRYGIVYLVRPKGENPDAVKALVEKKPEVEIDQQGCEFIPFATVLHQDQSLVFKSSDAANHNIHLSPFTNPQVNSMLAPGGVMKTKFMTEKRPIPLSCDIHPWMKGYVMVFDHPFFAVTSEDGSFEIKGVPPGEQKLVIWQSATGYVTPGKAAGMSVKVEAGGTTDIGSVPLDPAMVK